ncbi:GNAT family N-acetyltransferase [Hymenobacter sp. GOD-10R]|uniref:GNAT family N-acetyltransferase n=1 Tax=Hymenobacter sp. GOD-10R TaxID=3093922 RepID=UPI002D78ADA5|nr:GNAT family N-acetyltransferase [Hymenobacter sp. GOD-10R]WRQ29523.1 GNAT family N-acetyltransferase [Hymenobacter sp. GOD-10R]
MPSLVTIRTIQPEDTYWLRHSVLWPEKPLDYVKIAEDNEGLHFGAFQEEQLVGVISLFVNGEAARFRKFAVDPRYQRLGIGSELLTRVMQEASQQGARTIACDARQEATGLYYKFGMLPEGPEFYKGPIAYVRMQKALP